MKSTRTKLSLLATAGSLTLVASALLGAPPANAHPSHARHHHDAPKTVAQGLDNPRQLSFAKDGSLYVAEAGTGGTSNCMAGPEGGTVCFGLTGGVTRVNRGHQTRVLSHLPSIADTDGSSAIGAADIQVQGGRWVLSMGAGIDKTQRAAIGAKGRTLGTLQTGRVRSSHQRTLADIVAFEFARNPDQSVEHDSDPVGITSTWRGLVLADAGGNDLLRIDARGHVHTLAVFPDRIVTFPDSLGGGQGPMQAVPTSVAVGPDGSLYVSQLTGFPFLPGAANIWRVRPGHAPQVWASGLTNVTDLAWYRGRLYAVQIADGGLANATGLPMGSLLQVHRGNNATEHTVIGNLPAPYGVAIRDGSAYVTTCSVCPGGGSVLKVHLR